jgi:hypothetical protein
MSLLDEQVGRRSARLPDVGIRPVSTADRFTDAEYHRVSDARSKAPGANDGAAAWREQRFCV